MKINKLLLVMLLIVVVAIFAVIPAFAVAEETTSEATEITEELPSNIFNDFAAWIEVNKNTIFGIVNTIGQAILALVFIKQRLQVSGINGTLVNSTSMTSKNIADVVKTVNNNTDSSNKLQLSVLSSSVDSAISKIYAKAALELQNLMVNKAALPEATKNLATVIYADALKCAEKEIKRLSEV